MRYFVLVFLLISCQCSAQVYQGQIGKTPILLAIDQYENGSGLDFHYCYTKYLKEIKGGGTVKDNHLSLEVVDAYDGNTLETFELERGATILTGQWRMEGKVRNVYLELVPQQTNEEFDVQYQDLKKAHYKLERGRTERVGDKEIVWFKERHSDIKLFRLGNGFSQEAREALNPSLDKMHFFDVDLELECGWDMRDISKPYTHHIFSFKKTYSFYCYGAAHPVHSQVAYNYDINSGQKLEWKDVMQYTRPFELYTNYKKHFITAEATYEDCEYDESYYWEYPEFFLREDGLVLIPAVPHAATVCAVEFVLPWEHASKFVKAKFRP